jgi:hypothetical protein
MPTNKQRGAAAEVAQRIKLARMDPSKLDEADRDPNDKPPAYADVLMGETAFSIEDNAKLTDTDWDVIELALVNYAGPDSRS